MRPTRTPAALLAGAVAVALLAGCGEPTPEEVRADYCATVEDNQRRLSDRLSDGSPTALIDALPVFEDLARAAPSQIEADWRVLIDAVQALDDALADAGVDPASYDPAEPPEGLSRQERGAIERAAAELLNPRTQDAVAAVDQQARDVCRTPLFQ